MKRTLLLRCQCHCGALGVDDWGDAAADPDFPWSWSFEFYSRGWPGSGWERVKKAWLVLRGRDHVFDCVCLNGEDVIRLRDFLDAGLAGEIRGGE